jgi:hypothetical protein
MPHSSADIADHKSHHSSLAPTHDTLALALKQMAHINARQDAQSADTGAQRRSNAQRGAPRNVQPIHPNSDMSIHVHTEWHEGG